MKVKTVSKLKKELDAIFSKYIRLKYSKNGMVACYTCGHLGEVKKMQNGHCLPRQYLSMRFSEKNCRPQCYACNMLYGGQVVVFLNKLCDEYGDNFRHELEQEKWKVTKLDVVDYAIMISKYSKLVESML